MPDDAAFWQSMIGSYGFPIVVTGFLLWERKKLMEQLNTSLMEVKAALIEMTTIFRDRGGM